MNSEGDGRQCLVSRNQIDISPDLIGFYFIIFARYPKATNEESDDGLFTEETTQVISDMPLMR